jgi:hypothetical protein
MADLNDVILLILSENPARRATFEDLAAEIAARDLWRCPKEGWHPGDWQINLWVRSELARGLFAVNHSSVSLRRRTVPNRVHPGARRILVRD